MGMWNYKDVVGEDVVCACVCICTCVRVCTGLRGELPASLMP